MVNFKLDGKEMRNDVNNMSWAWDKETVVRASDQWSFDLRKFFGLSINSACSSC